VADERTRGPLVETAEIWIPISMERITRASEPRVDDPTAAWVQLFARKRPGLSDERMLAEMRILGPRAIAAHDSVRRAEVSVVPAAFLNTPDVRSDVVPVFSLIWLAFSLILVVACANVANMLLARGVSRQREIAIRLAIGGGRSRLVRQLLTESVWLGGLGGAAGLALAHGLGRIALTLVPGGVSHQLDVSPDRSVLAFSAAVSVVTGLAFGLLPALQTTRLDLSPGLKADGFVAGGKPRARLQHWLVGLQVTGSVVLLMNASLVVRSFTHALRLEVGKPLDHLLIASFDLQEQQYTAERGEEFFRRINEQIGGLPAVVASGASLLDPEVSSAQNIISVSDSGAAGGEEGFPVRFDEVGAGYFDAAGLVILAGRTFTEREVRAGAPVMIVDRRFAEERLGGRALGKRLSVGGMADQRWYEIVGVVNDTRPVGAGFDPMPTYFVPIRGLRYLQARLWIRYRGDAGSAMQVVRAAAERLDAEVGVRFSTIEENVRTALLPVRIASWSLTALGVLAISLASVGLFGVIAFSVGRRAREIAIRMALGAAPRRIVALVLRQGLWPVAGGLGVGLAAAIAVGHLSRALLYGLSPLDPAALGAVIGTVAGASALAFWLPARRATSLEPASVLRSD